MELNRQRKASLGVLGLALAGLFVDRAVIGQGGPSSVSASPSIELAQNALPVPIAQVAAGKPSFVADRLHSLRPVNTDLVDAFAGEPGWIRTEQADETDKGIAVATPIVDPFASAKKLRITSIMSREGQASVRVNGKTLRPGETIEGLLFERVDGTNAIFSDEHGTYALGLKGEIELIAASPEQR